MACEISSFHEIGSIPLISHASDEHSKVPGYNLKHKSVVAKEDVSRRNYFERVYFDYKSLETSEKVTDPTSRYDKTRNLLPMLIFCMEKIQNFGM
jgi:hypothetical protein